MAFASRDPQQLNAFINEAAPSAFRAALQAAGGVQKVRAEDGTKVRVNPVTGGVSLKACTLCHAVGNVQWCAGCKTTMYCSRECQRAHWPAHKAVYAVRAALGKFVVSKRRKEPGCKTAPSFGPIGMFGGEHAILCGQHANRSLYEDVVSKRCTTPQCEALARIDHPDDDTVGASHPTAT